MMRTFSRWLVIAAAAARLAAQAPDRLPGTSLLDWQGELDLRMMEGAHRFVERKIAESVETRQRHWKRDLSSREAYESSIAANRARFLEKTGVVDKLAEPALERYSGDSSLAPLARTDRYRVSRVRWSVLEGVHGEGLLLEPPAKPAAYVIALPDADQTPEQLAGLASGIPPESQFARVLAESGCLVLVPTLVSRGTRWSGRPDLRMSGQPHREWIYRQAFHMGRHIIGYEVQKVRAAVRWMGRRDANAKIGVAGYAEGGLVAFYAAAADPRIDAVLVSGYFDSRQKVWAEPVYRNVWGLLEEFGDAEIASLIAPRTLVVEFSRPPEIQSPKGDLTAPAYGTAQAEFARIDKLTRPGFQPKSFVAGPRPGDYTSPGSRDALSRFLSPMGARLIPSRTASRPAGTGGSFDPEQRQMRQVKELEAHVQMLVSESDRVRSRFFMLKAEPQLALGSWSTRQRHSTLDPARFIGNARWYREYFWKEVIGRFDEPLAAPNARTRKIYDTERYTGYETVLDVWPDVFAWGTLLVPKNIRPGERRPVVVCQHGRNGLPKDTIEVAGNAYNRFAAHLAEEGFVTFSPHNLYRGEDRYRYLSRKGNGVKASLFSFIAGQHDQVLRWLETLPFVDGSRMAFYGLSYGGETAVRVPAILERYALSICSGDFNQWTRKVAATGEDFSFMYTIEWEMPYFNMGSTFDYAEMSYLIFPRPFMVERGHHDLVGRDHWVAYEYAKTAWLYAQFAMADRTAIEYFQGGHAINGQGTFEFLRKHLGRPGKE
ncbi:MAG: dienelactone hydrolase family protein [Bryobacterales bacterium]|nr:dienelactone hydrolase family protein [Bryobacterales bacterium]